MDTFINLAKQGYETYSESQSQSHVHKTGGQEFNSPDNRPPQSYRSSQYNSDEVRQHVDSDSHGFLDNAMSHAHRTVQEQGDIDEDGVQNLKNAHHQAFSSEGQGPSGMTPDSMGGAAAFKALTDMMSGGGSHGSSGGGDMQSKLVGMAMQHASSLFDQSGGGSSEAKQSAMNSAATYAMQLMMKKEMSNFIGGSSSGGLSGIMGMASKFM
ncbi:beta-flanking protein [Suillus lakei]|nr:beta-flanking protein [Suillus lakei]